MTTRRQRSLRLSRTGSWSSAGLSSSPRPSRVVTLNNRIPDVVSGCDWPQFVSSYFLFTNVVAPWKPPSWGFTLYLPQQLRLLPGQRGHVPQCPQNQGVRSWTRLLVAIQDIPVVLHRLSQSFNTTTPHTPNLWPQVGVNDRKWLTPCCWEEGDIPSENSTTSWRRLDSCHPPRPSPVWSDVVLHECCSCVDLCQWRRASC